MLTTAVLWGFLGTASLALTLATDRTPLTVRKVIVAYAVGPVALAALVVVGVVKGVSRG
jgi:hypothetical protein